MNDNENGKENKHVGYFQEISTPTLSKVVENKGGSGGVSKAKNLKGTYEIL